MITHQIFFSV
jgi:hypothetical protein